MSEARRSFSFWELSGVIATTLRSTPYEVILSTRLRPTRVRHPSRRTFILNLNRRTYASKTENHHGDSSSLDCLFLQSATMATDETMLSRRDDSPFASAVREQLEL
jgi:hypothetical protein